MAKTKIQKPEYPISIETFRNDGLSEMLNLKHDNPSCFNFNVNIRKYRITVELIDEPHGVLCARLQELWDNCGNYHNAPLLKSEANRLGYILEGMYGNKLK